MPEHGSRRRRRRISTAVGSSRSRRPSGREQSFLIAFSYRLFGRITELIPHDVDETLSVNNIRSVILAMARPLAEIARNQMLNSRLIEEKIKEVCRNRI